MPKPIPILTEKLETLYKNYLATKPKEPITKEEFILAHCEFTKESYPISSELARNAVVTYMNIHKHSSFDSAAKGKCLICNPKEPKAKKRK
jgi:hypothetical protein